MVGIKYDSEYFEGITAPYIDWVGGGNFDTKKSNIQRT